MGELEDWKHRLLRLSDDPTRSIEINVMPRRIIDGLMCFKCCGMKIKRDNRYDIRFLQRLKPKSQYRRKKSDVRVSFSILVSLSNFIERDFGVRGNIVNNNQHMNLADHNVVMCSFVNINREFVDLLQCEISQVLM